MSRPRGRRWANYHAPWRRQRWKGCDFLTGPTSGVGARRPRRAACGVLSCPVVWGLIILMLLGGCTAHHTAAVGYRSIEGSQPSPLPETTHVTLYLPPLEDQRPNKGNLNTTSWQTDLGGPDLFHLNVPAAEVCLNALVTELERLGVRVVTTEEQADGILKGVLRRFEIQVSSQKGNIVQVIAETEIDVALYLKGSTQPLWKGILRDVGETAGHYQTAAPMAGNSLSLALWQAVNQLGHQPRFLPTLTRLATAPTGLAALPPAAVAPLPSGSQKTPSPPPPTPPLSSERASERRLALVIGNGTYQQAGRLRNPVNDARDIAAVLGKLRFEVTLKENAKYRDMEDAIRRFSKELRGGDMGLFYFAGHGMQIDGHNYLIPVDAALESAADVKYKTVAMGWIFDLLQEAQSRFNVIIFDACRNNPFPHVQRAGLRGLAVVPTVHGSLISYSTSPDAVAEDGAGRNSPYTKALLRYLPAPGVAIEQMFKQVRIAVQQETNGKQIPWELSSLVGDFYFAEK